MVEFAAGELGVPLEADAMPPVVAKVHSFPPTLALNGLTPLPPRAIRLPWGQPIGGVRRQKGSSPDTAARHRSRTAVRTHTHGSDPRANPHSLPHFSPYYGMATGLRAAASV